MTRSWRMFAGRPDRVVDGREFLDFGDERTVQFRGRIPVEVELTEDRTGQYWGWVESPNSARLTDRRTGVPMMVQPHEGMFRMQSPDGFAQDVNRGYGWVVRMSCHAVDA